MIKINGVDLPTPSGYSIGIMDLSKAERNVKGSMIIERIATKVKIELAWNNLSKENLATVLNLVSAVFFTVQYIDPQTNVVRQGSFYTGDRTAGALSYIGGSIRYKDIKFSLIER